MYKLLLPVMGLAAFVACEPTECVDDTSETGDQCADDTSGDTNNNGGDPSIDLTWDASGVTVELHNMNTSGFDFGMAETIDMTNGWFGEDCLNGTLGYQECHIISGTTGSLTSIYDDVQNETKTLDDVQSGQTTLFEKSFDDGNRITYVVTIDGGDCFVWGHDPSYYLDDPDFDSCSRLN